MRDLLVLVPVMLVVKLTVGSCSDPNGLAWDSLHLVPYVMIVASLESMLHMTLVCLPLQITLVI